jgi:lysophospholipase L1-like esterase
VKRVRDNDKHSISELVAQAFRNQPHIASTFGINYYTAFTTAVTGGQTHMTVHTPLGDIDNMQLIYGNHKSASSIDEANTNDITVQCSLETGGVIIPLFFQGKKTVVIAPGGIAVTDPVGITIPGGTDFIIRSFVQADGGAYPRGYANYGRVTGNIVESGTYTPNSLDGYSPMCVIGNTTAPSILIVGDSVGDGTGDTNYTLNGRSILNKGFATRAFCETKNFVNLSRSGMQLAHYADIRSMAIRGRLAGYAKYAIVQLGLNDMRTGGALQTAKNNALALWQTLSDKGLLVYQTTITPESTSTDSWATVENQTTKSFNPTRIAFNDWVRSTPAPLSGYLDMADAVETARNSGIWKAAYTGDGIHPLAAGHIAMAAAVDMDIFT